MLVYLLDAFSGPAGPFMYALLLVLSIGLAVATERAWSFASFRVAPEKIEGALSAARMGGDLSLGSTPLENVLKAGLAESDADRAWEAMAAAGVEAELRIRRRVSYLSTIASVSTMLGLFGTVYGLILAFGAMGDVAAAARAAQLSEGSATAMATTAFGLFVAIPCLLAHAVAEARVRELLGQIEATATRLSLAIRARST